jgi:hypothetical protein
LEVNVVLIGFNGDGGYRYTIDAHKLEQLLKTSFPTHRPSCSETEELLDIEHHLVYNAFSVSYFSCSSGFVYVSFILILLLIKLFKPLLIG